MSNKVNIQYTKETVLEKERENQLKEIILNNNSKWLIAIESYYLGRESINKKS